MDAGGGIEPPSRAYETRELPLLYPAIYQLLICLAFACTINIFMQHIEYLDWPPIPEHLIQPVTDIMQLPIVKSWGPLFFIRNIQEGELKIWLESLMENHSRPIYQSIHYDLPIHTDAGPRLFAYNYILDTGGTNVVTSVFNDDNECLQSEILVARRWHRITTSKPHNVKGLEKGRIRLAISLPSLT